MGTKCTSVCTSVRNLLVMERTYYRYMYLQHGVGRDHTRVRRYNTCAVTQIGVGSDKV